MTRHASDRNPTFSRRAGRRGLSILETMLALAILGGTLAALGELVRTGTRAAQRAEDVTIGQMLCENLINETVVGLRPLNGGQGVFPDYPEWAYMIEVMPVDEQGGLLAVAATVMHNDGTPQPFQFQLIRWTIDPVFKYPPPPEEEELADEQL